MNGAGLTDGQFYSHFGSMDDLTAEAVTRALCHGGFFGMICAKLDVDRHRVRCISLIQKATTIAEHEARLVG
jgi:AcrR family transcriptional regulator